MKNIPRYIQLLAASLLITTSIWAQEKTQIEKEVVVKNREEAIKQVERYLIEGADYVAISRTAHMFPADDQKNDLLVKAIFRNW